MMARRIRRPSVRPHPYTEATTVPADHRGLRPCICGRARANAAHDQAAVTAASAALEDAQAAHRRRIGDED